MSSDENSTGERLCVCLALLGQWCKYFFFFFFSFVIIHWFCIRFELTISIRSMSKRSSSMWNGTEEKHENEERRVTITFDVDFTYLIGLYHCVSRFFSSNDMSTTFLSHSFRETEEENIDRIVLTTLIFFFFFYNSIPAWFHFVLIKSPERERRKEFIPDITTTPRRPFLQWIGRVKNKYEECVRVFLWLLTKRAEQKTRIILFWSTNETLGQMTRETSFHFALDHHLQGRRSVSFSSSIDINVQARFRIEFARRRRGWWRVFVGIVDDAFAAECREWWFDLDLSSVEKSGDERLKCQSIFERSFERRLPSRCFELKWKWTIDRRIDRSIEWIVLLLRSMATLWHDRWSKKQKLSLLHCLKTLHLLRRSLLIGFSLHPSVFIHILSEDSIVLFGILTRYRVKTCYEVRMRLPPVSASLLIFDCCLFRSLLSMTTKNNWDFSQQENC